MLVCTDVYKVVCTFPLRHQGVSCAHSILYPCTLDIFADMDKNKLRSEGETLFPGDSARGTRPADTDEGKWLPLTSRFEGPDVMNYRSVTTHINPKCINSTNGHFCG